MKPLKVDNAKLNDYVISAKDRVLYTGRHNFNIYCQNI